MGKQYSVHSRHDTIVKEPTKTEDGHVVMGDMPAAIVELVPLKGGATLTITERMPKKEDRTRIEALFPVGGVVEMGEFTFVKKS